ncbi:MAG: hypothetical protein J2P20_18450 [Pseudonocardia sp.]|nr:hypothetical protein [Pseudonocardia sp.]MBO0874134.1 hypothetical protein [Pseudonocardia sp.]
MPTTELSHRDRAVLRAVADGRCTVSRDSLTVDGYAVADHFAGRRLIHAGLIAGTGPMPAPARLTRTGHAVLQAA